jgi:hypothetical protein
MSWNKLEQYEQLKALQNFTGMQYRVVELATSEINAATFAAAGQGYGVLFNEPRSGEAATVVIGGQVRCRAAVAVTLGDPVTTAASATGGSGWATKVLSGMTGPVKMLGRARTTAASGSIFVLDMTERMILAPNSAGQISGAF